MSSCNLLRTWIAAGILAVSLGVTGPGVARAADSDFKRGDAPQSFRLQREVVSPRFPNQPQSPGAAGAVVEREQPDASLRDPLAGASAGMKKKQVLERYKRARRAASGAQTFPEAGTEPTPPVP